MRPSGGDPALGPNAYAAGEALFDRTNPAHLLTQTDKPVLKPELPYEKTGQYAAGTTFAEGLVCFHKQVVSLLRMRGFAGGCGDCAG